MPDFRSIMCRRDARGKNARESIRPNKRPEILLVQQQLVTAAGQQSPFKERDK